MWARAKNVGPVRLLRGAADLLRVRGLQNSSSDAVDPPASRRSAAVSSRFHSMRAAKRTRKKMLGLCEFVEARRTFSTFMAGGMAVQMRRIHPHRAGAPGSETGPFDARSHRTWAPEIVAPAARISSRGRRNGRPRLRRGSGDYPAATASRHSPSLSRTEGAKMSLRGGWCRILAAVSRGGNS